MRKIHSKYTYLILFTSIIAIGDLLLPMLGNIKGIYLFTGNYVRESLPIQATFIWMFRIAIVALVILPFLAVILSNWNFSFICLGFSSLSLILILIFGWSGSSMDARQPELAVYSSPRIGLFLLAILGLMSVYGQSRILFGSNKNSTKIIY